MSPARSKRTPIPHRRSRAEIVTAVGVAAGIVLVTSLVVWLMRPGPAGTLGTGGLMNRQPRASWLVGAALGLAALSAWWILRVSRRARGHEKVALPVSLGVVVVAAVIGGFAWPGGVLRHDHAPPPPPPTTTTAPTTSTSPATTTTVNGATTTTPGTGSTTAAPSTSSPAGQTTAPPAATTSTGSPTNTSG